MLFTVLLLILVPTPPTQDVTWTKIRRSEDVQDVFWTPYVRSIYVLCLGTIFLHEMHEIQWREGWNLHPVSSFWSALRSALNAEAHLEPYQTYKMERFVKVINGFQLLTLFTKLSIFDVWQGSKYVWHVLRIFFLCVLFSFRMHLL